MVLGILQWTVSICCCCSGYSMTFNKSLRPNQSDSLARPDLVQDLILTSGHRVAVNSPQHVLSTETDMADGDDVDGDAQSYNKEVKNQQVRTRLSWGSFLPPACWLGEELVGSAGGLAGVRRVCGRNVEKKFLEGGVATLTAR